MPNNQNLQQPLKIWAELAHYQIEKVLGSGGFGITYLAMDLNLERQVVIKEFFLKTKSFAHKAVKYSKSPVVRAMFIRTA